MALGHRNKTAVVASSVERTKCGRVIFSVYGEGDLYSIERERERERERRGGAITKQRYLNKSGVGMQIGCRRLKIGSAGRY